MSKPSIEDQQRINTFSKLNNRLRLVFEKLKVLRVRQEHFPPLPRLIITLQKQEREALDDLSTEVELADEDQPVL